ncbi:unnamed protein product, partial [Rodentolepis nana]|uniref:FYVE, RhoGEF and PH domain-containing protein 6 n=1 Tax=Rodentolepis nana TaxID=102285 RepID=A0A0R3T6V8_RODNA
MSGSFKFNCTSDSAPKNTTPITPVTNGYSVLMPTLAATKNACLKNPLKCWTKTTPESAHHRPNSVKNGHDNGITRNSIKKSDKTPTIKAARLASKGSSHYDDTPKIVNSPSSRNTAESTNSEYCTPSVQGFSEVISHKSSKNAKPFKSKSADYIRPEVTTPQKSKSADAMLRSPKESSKTHCKQEVTKQEENHPDPIVIAHCQKLIADSQKPCLPESSQPVIAPQTCAPTKSESDMKASKTHCKQKKTKQEDIPPKPLGLEECQKLIADSQNPCPPETSQPVIAPQTCAPTKSESDMKASKTHCKQKETKQEENHPDPTVIAHCQKLIADSQNPCPPESSQPITVPKTCAPTKSESDMKASKTHCKQKETKQEENHPDPTVIAHCQKLIADSQNPCPPETSQPVIAPQTCAPTKSESDMKASKTHCKQKETKQEENHPDPTVIAHCQKLIADSQNPCPPETSQPVITPQTCAPTKSESDMKASKTHCKQKKTKQEDIPPKPLGLEECQKLIADSQNPCPPETSQPVIAPQTCAPTKSESDMKASKTHCKQKKTKQEDIPPKPLGLEECQKLIADSQKPCPPESSQPVIAPQTCAPTKSE